MGAGLAARGLVLFLGVCGGGPSSSAHGAYAPGGPPTANEPLPSSIGKGEGRLNLVAWQGYAEPEWVKPFEEQTGCQVNTTYAESSDQMIGLMAERGGGQYDVVSAAAAAGLQLIYDGDVRPVNVKLIPDWKDFRPQFQGPAFNTAGGTHYGVSVQWGPNVLLYNDLAFPSPPTSWSVIYDSRYRGQITVPDTPLQIADAALYLGKTQPRLGITDPSELTPPQFAAAVTLLKRQRPLVRKYWTQASEEISIFKDGEVVVGAGWPYQAKALNAIGTGVTDSIPIEGATGWADTWMLATRARHPNCAYLWMRFVSTPYVQAQQATSYGETPVNVKACAEMEKLQAGSCARYHADAPSAYVQSLRFWKTPIVTCDDGRNECEPYEKWRQAWSEITR